MGLGFILLIGGLVIIFGLYFWSRQRQTLGYIPQREQADIASLPLASSDDAVLVSRAHGQLIYVNDRARRWLGMNGGDPNLEFIAGMAQPTDSFLELFAGEGQASFQLGQRWVEASSHTIPAGGETRTVIVMREITANTSQPDALDLSLAMNAINEIGETVNASMTVDEAHQTLLRIVMKAIPAEAGEICMWDDNDKTLSPRGWVGDTNYLIKLQENGGLYRLGEGIGGWVAQHRKAVLVHSIYDRAAVQPKLSNFYRSFVAVPLVLGDRFIGTLELAHPQANHFGQASLALLQAISKQVAIAIYNAELYSRQARRISDMASLQDLIQGVQGNQDARSIYRSLNERIAKLISAEVSGVLFYDEPRRSLIPELPFHGLTDNLAVNCVISLPPDSPQRDIWERQPYWVTNDAPHEPLIEALGLTPVFNAAGIKNTALIPMEIGNQRVGMM